MKKYDLVGPSVQVYLVGGREILVSYMMMVMILKLVVDEGMLMVLGLGSGMWA